MKKLIKLDKSTNRYYIDRGKISVYREGAREYGEHITKLAMYENTEPDPTKLASMLQVAQELLRGNAMTETQAEIAAAECEKSAERAARAMLDWVLHKLKYESEYEKVAEWLEGCIAVDNANGRV